jgi:hypothetical protein
VHGGDLPRACARLLEYFSPDVSNERLSLSLETEHYYTVMRAQIDTPLALTPGDRPPHSHSGRDRVADAETLVADEQAMGEIRAPLAHRPALTPARSPPAAAWPSRSTWPTARASPFASISTTPRHPTFAA